MCLSLRKNRHLELEALEDSFLIPPSLVLFCSFGEAEEDADDGEVFKVRKSSYSRRIAKELEKERRRKKYEDSEPTKVEEAIPVKKEDQHNRVKTIDVPLAEGIDGIRIKVGDRIRSLGR